MANASTTQRERAEPPESTKKSERAVAEESTISSERANVQERTNPAERPDIAVMASEVRARVADVQAALDEISAACADFKKRKDG
jgi:hypothetical protein